MYDWKADFPAHLLDSFFVDGRWLRGSPERRKEIVSPSTEEVVASVPFATIDVMEMAIAAAKRAFEIGPWPRMSPQERSGLMRKLADRLSECKELAAHIWTAQVGAPIAMSSRLAPLTTLRLRYFADLAASFQFETERRTQLGYAKVIEEPVGVSALITPWNAALPILMTKLGAALAAGCTCVIKASPESPLDAMLVAQCVQDVGFPTGVVNVVLADTEVSAQLVASPDVSKVSFTGSVATGSAIASVVAARMGRLTLELGGKAAAILLDTVEIERALPTLEQFSMPFSGQFCFSQSRILVPRARESELTEVIADRIGAFKVGDPWNNTTQIGPVLNRRQFDRVMDFINDGVKDGAEIVTGGRARSVSNRGHYIEPTVIRNVGRQTPLAREEIFGPVVTIHSYDTVEEAISIANDTAYGLSGTVFGETQQALSVARQVRTGQVGVNGLELTPAAPFGGFKMSGFGREGGPEGVKAFLETKAILFPGGDK